MAISVGRRSIELAPKKPTTPGQRSRTYWTSAGIVSDGSYGVPEGLISSFPVRFVNGAWEIIQGLPVNDFSRGKIDATVAELAGERDAVKELGLL